MIARVDLLNDVKLGAPNLTNPKERGNQVGSSQLCPQGGKV